MSTLRDPVGPEDKKVYVRRRLIVLACLLAVVVAIVLIIVKPGGSGGAASAREVQVPDDLVAAEQEESAQAADPEAVPACTDSQLQVTPLTDRESYAAGELPQLSISIENAGEADCQADLGTAGMTFEITSGSDQVWRSVDCQQHPDHRAVIVQPGKAITTEAIEWDRTRSSAETCDIAREEVYAGGSTYHLRVTAGGVSGSGTAPFLLY